MVLGKIISTTLKQEVLSKYKTEIFIETGTACGGGVKIALSVGFSKIFSIEINKDLYLANLEKFKNNKEVILIHGDSGLEFPSLISKIDRQATFWLDAHFHKRKQVIRTWCPLYEELQAISTSPIKNHIIMIDDMRVFGNSMWGKRVSKEKVIEKILSINPNYKITYEDNTMAEKDVLVATI